MALACPYKSIFISVLTIHLLVITLRAQSVENIVFVPIGENGSLFPTVTCLLQDHVGFIWLCTQDGLSRYDGYEFVTYKSDVEVDNSVSDDFIHTLLLGDGQTLWIGTRNGLSNYDLKLDKFANYTKDNSGLVHNNILSLERAGPGKIWVGTESGLDNFDFITETATPFASMFPEGDTLSNRHIKVIYRDEELLWVGTKNGLNRIDLSSGRVTTYLVNEVNKSGESEKNEIWDLFGDSDGNVWIGTDGNGLKVYDPISDSVQDVKFEVPGQGLLENLKVSSINKDVDSSFWIGTDGNGVILLNKNTQEFNIYQNREGSTYSLVNNKVTDIFRDLNDRIWLATWSGMNQGVPKEEKILSYKPSSDKGNSLSHRMIMPILETADGVLWISTLGGGLNKYSRAKNEIIHYKHIPGKSNSLSNDEIWALHEDSRGFLWIGTSGGGLNRFDPQSASFVHYLYNPQDKFSLHSPLNRIYSIYEDSRGDLWVGTVTGGLNRYNYSTDSFEVFTSSESDSTTLSNNRVNPLFEDSNGVFWIGTYGGGLNKFIRETETFVHYRHNAEDSTSISSDMVTVITEYPQGTLWVGTFGGGLNRFNPESGTFKRYTTKDGLPDDIIAGILSDDEGNLWISTNNGGITRFNPESETFRNYDERDGLQSDRFHIGSYYKSDSGEMFFGGNNGFNSFFPNYLKDDPTPPRVVFTEFTVDGTSQNPHPDSSLTKAAPYADSVYIKPDQREFSFKFAALHYKNPDKNEYRYMLEGYDEGWRYNGTERETITFGNLSPRTYTLKVIASNSDGMWMEERDAAAITVIVEPAWYETWFARIAYLLAAGFGVLGIVRWRVRQVERENERLELTVKERTAEIEEQKEVLEEQNVQLEDQKDKLEVQAEQLMEMDRVKSNFFANISHEFRTPLTLIMGPARDALEGKHGPLRDSLAQHLNLVARSAESLEDLIDQLLNLSRLEAGQLMLHVRCYDIVSAIQDTVTLFHARAEPRGIALSVEADEEELLLFVDREKLERILNNLLSNAFKFTPDGGAIKVLAYSVQADDARWVEFAVEDNGEGIAPEVLPHVFDRFRQGDASSTRTHGGTGIGLALTRELVELHGGSIEATSTLGKGTTFTVRIPTGTDHLPADVVMLGDEEPARYQPAKKPPTTSYSDIEVVAEQAPDDAPTILVVEDHKDVRTYIRDFLSSRYRVFEAENGEEGLLKAREVQPDLIVSDVMMPKMNGFDLCNAIKGDPALEHIPIVLLTARASDESRQEGLESKADAYLVKPFKGAELMVWVENLIDIRRKLMGKMRLGPEEKVVDSEDALFIDKVRLLVEANIASIKVEDLAHDMALSPKQFSRRIKEITGLSGGQAYIRMMKLERAAQLLEQQAGRVGEIALQVGFRDAEFFGRIFKQAYSVTPRDYAKGKRA